MSYQTEIVKNQYLPNVIILLKGEYFSIRQPDSGLSVNADNNGAISSINISPTAIDPFRPTSAINNFSFKLTDNNNVVTALFSGDPGYLVRQPVDIWIGRCRSPLQTEDMDFSEYYKLPRTTVQKISKVDSGYTFQCIEARDRLFAGRFQVTSKLAVDILAATTEITLTDVTDFPASGYIQIEKEIISYSSISGFNLEGCIRGVLGTPADHSSTSIVLVTTIIQGNPIDLLLQLLISKGGGGVYDVLDDGAGIDQSLVDITQMQQIRDEFFSTYEFKLIVQNLDSLRSFMENEILFPLGIRLRSNLNSKLGLALLDRRIFDIDSPTLNSDTLTKNPQFSSDDNKIVNAVQVSWDWDDANQVFNQVSNFIDSDSITTWGKSTVSSFQFKGIKSSLSGSTAVNSFQGFFLRRFSQPRPSISVNVLMSQSQAELSDKVDLVTNRLPNTSGELNFAETLEIVQKSINYQTGDVLFQLAFTAFAGVRECYIAPSDTIISHSGKSMTLGAGRGSYWRAGWFCRLYDNTSRDYAISQINQVFSVVGDVVTFVDNWTITIIDNQHRIMFADYPDVTAQQQKYCFICQNLGTFPDGTNPYQILFGGGI